MTTSEIENATSNTPVKTKGPLRNAASKARRAIFPKKPKAEACPAELDVSLSAPCAFDIELGTTKEGITAPQALVTRLNVRSTGLADSAQARHQGAAERHAAVLAAKKEKAAAQKRLAEAAAARRAAPTSSEAVEEEAEEAVEETEAETDGVSEADVKKAGRASLMGRLSRLSKGPISMLTPRKTPRQSAPIPPHVPTPVAFEIETEKREGVTAPEGLVERLASKRTALATSALTRHADAAERRAALAAAKQAKASARNTKAATAAARRLERVETLAEKVQARMVAATARATTTLIICAAVAGACNAKVADAAVRRAALKESAAIALGAELAATLIDGVVAAEAKAAAERDALAAKAAKPHGMLKMFKLPRLFGGARAA